MKHSSASINPAPAANRPLRNAGENARNSAPSVGRPITIRIPRIGERDPYTGLGRAPILALITPNEANGGKPPVKSFLVKRPGAQRGTRVVSLDSLLSYIHAQLAVSA